MRTCPFGSSTLSTITRPWGIFSTPHDQEPLVTAPWVRRRAAGCVVACTGAAARGAAAALRIAAVRAGTRAALQALMSACVLQTCAVRAWDSGRRYALSLAGMSQAHDAPLTGEPPNIACAGGRRLRTPAELAHTGCTQQATQRPSTAHTPRRVRTRRAPPCTHTSSAAKPLAASSMRSVPEPSALSAEQNAGVGHAGVA